MHSREREQYREHSEVGHVAMSPLYTVLTYIYIYIYTVQVAIYVTNLKNK